MGNSVGGIICWDFYSHIYILYFCGINSFFVSTLSLTKKIVYILTTIASIAIVVFYFNFSPKSFNFFPKCPFYVLTGFHCPGCGSQRAFHEILHGNIIGGIQHNLLIVLAVLIIGYKFFVFFRNKKRPQKSNQNLLYHNATPWVILILVVGFWIIRNIPYAPFCYLAP
ncbi:DUF2752 domain-containing protein [Psychroflexus aestuariivivens]|uniref:DUF2752 domain-containing protein n=1 Tax=Psychroflexus aestuariivivens TaxID=1795040 RepID=UPI002938E5C1|nr:DUF2752 domain-containing protein [Psychroflexus aestuariivivens]